MPHIASKVGISTNRLYGTAKDWCLRRRLTSRDDNDVPRGLGAFDCEKLRGRNGRLMSNPLRPPVTAPRTHEHSLTFDDSPFGELKRIKIESRPARRPPHTGPHATSKRSQTPARSSRSALEAAVRARLAELGVPADELIRYTVFRRAHDARKRADIKLTYIVDVEVTRRSVGAQAARRDVPHCSVTPDMAYRFVAKAPAQSTLPRPVVIGMGPCGLFAGLILAQMGFRPIILERGKAVRERTKDTWGLWRKNVLNPESNVQFGEGGAGTFSDGKLYSQIKDPKHYGRKVLDEFVKAGAPEDILYLSRPHIGTFRLVSMVEKMRATIHRAGRRSALREPRRGHRHRRTARCAG